MKSLRLLSIGALALCMVALSACTTTNEAGDRKLDIEQTMDNSCLALKAAEGAYQIALSVKPDLLSESDKKIGEYAKIVMLEICTKPYPMDLNAAISKALDIATQVGKVVARVNAASS